MMIEESIYFTSQSKTKILGHLVPQTNQGLLCLALNRLEAVWPICKPSPLPCATFQNQSTEPGHVGPNAHAIRICCLPACQNRSMSVAQLAEVAEQSIMGRRHLAAHTLLYKPGKARR